MRPKIRIKRILEKLERIWTEKPDLRFGQLLIDLGLANDNMKLWEAEDDKLEERLDNILGVKRG